MTRKSKSQKFYNDIARYRKILTAMYFFPVEMSMVIIKEKEGGITDTKFTGIHRDSKRYHSGRS